MKPVAFQRVRRLDDPSKLLEKYLPEDLVVQEKYDGFKVLAVKESPKVYLYTRRGNEFSEKMPAMAAEVSHLLPNQTSVLGELVYINEEGKQDLYRVQQLVRSGVRRSREKQRKLPGQLVFYIYDVLEWKGEDITSLPLSERQVYVSRIVGRKPSIFDQEFGVIRGVPNYKFEELDQALVNSVRAGGEGVVIKVKDSPYEYGELGRAEPFGDWYKFKAPQKAQTIDVFTDSYEKLESRLRFKVFQYDGMKKVFIGNVSNLSRDDELKAKKMIDAGEKVVMEISFQERLPSGRLRHIAFRRLRPDKPASSATVRENPMPLRLAAAPIRGDELARYELSGFEILCYISDEDCCAAIIKPSKKSFTVVHTTSYGSLADVLEDAVMAIESNEFSFTSRPPILDLPDMSTRYRTRQADHTLRGERTKRISERMNKIVSGSARYNPPSEMHEGRADGLLGEAEAIIERLVMRPKFDESTFNQFIEAHRMTSKAAAHAEYLDYELQKRADQLLFDLEGYMRELVSSGGDYGD